MLNLSEMAKPLKQSGIRAASSMCRERGGINLGQGICDINIIDEIKSAAKIAIDENHSTYSPCEGIYPLREAVSQKNQRFNGFYAKPESEIIITHGATGAFVCATKTLFNPGDEVIVFEPFYGYHKNILDLMNVSVKGVPFNMDDLSIDFNHLEKAISPKTKGIIICTPNNPTGKVFSKNELLTIGEMTIKHNLAILTDEIYEYITYDDYQHISMAALSDELKARTITISGFSKTFNMTGWRLGYASGPAHIIEKMALIQDYYYVSPVTPLQHAGIKALNVSNDYYQQLQSQFSEKKALTLKALDELGFSYTTPQGAYYILANCQHINEKDSQKAVDYLMDKANVATVSGKAFYLNPENGRHHIRLCYALDSQILDRAYQQLANVC